MVDIATALTMIASFLPVVFFTAIAFWQRNAVLFMLAAGTSAFCGFAWYDNYGTSLGMATSLSLLAYALFCIFMAFRYIFWKGEIE